MSRLRHAAWLARRWVRARWPVPADGWVEVRRRGFEWRLRRGRYVDDSIYLDGVFERETSARVLEVARPGMYALDVGANLGYFTLLLARAVGPAGRVWASEPVDEWRARLAWHLERNNLADRVTVLPFGLSARRAELDIALGAETASFAPPGDDGTAARQRVRLEALDDVADGLGLHRLDLVKVDIDGHEPAFLEGAAGTLKRLRPVMVIEFAQANLDAAGSHAEALRARLEGLGYELRSERTWRPFSSRMEFLRECCNYGHSVNVWAFPLSGGDTGTRPGR